jgi:hypothetical protein
MIPTAPRDALELHSLLALSMNPDLAELEPRRRNLGLGWPS